MYSRICAAVVGLLLLGSGLALAATSYTQVFDVAPLTPQPARPVTDWDVAVHSDSVGGTWDTLAASPLEASHGADCGAPPATHHVATYDDAVFFCRNHIMTAINADGGYGVIYLTPPQMLDFSAGEAVLRWDMSTLRTSTRDWVDVWVSPYADRLQLPLEDSLPDLQGPPRNAIHLRMDQPSVNPLAAMFRVRTVRNFVEGDLPGNSYADWLNVLVPDAARRDTFELRMTRTHLKFWMPAYGLVWFDGDVADLGWDQGVVQLGHHSYNPSKACDFNGTCGPDTWHWDQVTLSSAVPFSIIPVSPRSTSAASTVLTFAQPAPEQATLQFAAFGSNVQVSWDGVAWANAPTGNEMKHDQSHADTYQVPVPIGATQARVRASGGGGTALWQARDFSVWSQFPVAPNQRTPTPTRLPTAVPTVPPGLPTVAPPPPPPVTVVPVSTATPVPPPSSGAGVRAVPPGWDWTLDAGTNDQQRAFQGPGAMAPPACDGSQSPTTPPDQYDYGLWQCPDHLTFRTNTYSYGHQFLTAPGLVDFTTGEAVVSWEMSTQQLSGGRDWIELWVSPLGASVPDPDGRYFITAPAEAVYMRMDNPAFFHGVVVRDRVATAITTNGQAHWTDVLTPSGSRRERFELHLSRTHVKFGMPAYNLWWTDTDVADLGWTQGVVQFGQAVYKSNLDGGATNWAFTLPTLSPSQPLTILRGDQQDVRAGAPTVTFAQPAPAGSMLKFIGLGSSQSVSFDGGVTYQRVLPMPVPNSFAGRAFGENTEHYTPYQIAVPAGVQAVQFRGQDVTIFQGPWEAHDIALYASGSPPPPLPPATPTAIPVPPTATVTPLPTATPGPTRTLPPSPTLLPTSTPAPNPTATPAPSSLCALVSLINGLWTITPQAPTVCPQ